MARAKENRDDRAGEVACLLKLLANPFRVRMCRMLAEGDELSAGEIGRRLGMSSALTSHHLALLRAASVVAARRGGQFVFYSLAPETRTRLATSLLYLFGLEGMKIPGPLG